MPGMADSKFSFASDSERSIGGFYRDSYCLVGLCCTPDPAPDCDDGRLRYAFAIRQYW